MSNFRFDYNDIHKQGTIADLSDEKHLTADTQSAGKCFVCS